MATVVLVRHGETTWNREGRIQGWADSALTDRGREQARAAGARLASGFDVDRLVASDLQRTRETVALVRDAGLDREPEFDRAWRERDFGDFQGLTRSAVADRLPDYDSEKSLLTLQSVTDGESLTELRDRVSRGWDRLVAGLDADETAVVVTHGGPVRVVLALATGRQTAALAGEFSPRNCGLTVLECEADGADGFGDHGGAFSDATDGSAAECVEVVSRDDCDHLPVGREP